MTYYNAIVITDYQAKITYHNFSQMKVKPFVDWCLKNLSVERIFFYRLPYRAAKSGRYCGYWNPKNGLVLNQ